MVYGNRDALTECFETLASEYSQETSRQPDSLSFKNGVECFLQAVRSVRDSIEIFTVTLKLKTELSVLYERQDFQLIHGTLQLLIFIIDNIEYTFQEVTKLLCILFTTPMTIAEAECGFPALKRVKAYLRNTMCQDCLNALAMLSI
ncbi:hypothetical protein PR048_032010 [Dryococelus australis]|uniref:HAT C-terminal dimerisation domain-containing protein n=1 Tax=Dryococelus australis TaxID=614101 RepID=A0ABQ9GAX2_9NEOP|nr:hypothetical protein PR048_032010 [Dryococelus australis]